LTDKAAVEHGQTRLADNTVALAIFLEGVLLCLDFTENALDQLDLFAIFVSIK